MALCCTVTLASLILQPSPVDLYLKSDAFSGPHEVVGLVDFERLLRPSRDGIDVEAEG